jgi:hypothetical protein
MRGRDVCGRRVQEGEVEGGGGGSRTSRGRRGL